MHEARSGEPPNERVAPMDFTARLRVVDVRMANPPSPFRDHGLRMFDPLKSVVPAEGKDQRSLFLVVTRR